MVICPSGSCLAPFWVQLQSDHLPFGPSILARERKHPGAVGTTAEPASKRRVPSRGTRGCVASQKCRTPGPSAVVCRVPGMNTTNEDFLLLFLRPASFSLPPLCRRLFSWLHEPPCCPFAGAVL